MLSPSHYRTKSLKEIFTRQSGDHAAIAYSILKKHHFDKVKNYSGGMKEWLANGGKTVNYEILFIIFGTTNSTKFVKVIK